MSTTWGQGTWGTGPYGGSQGVITGWGAGTWSSNSWGGAGPVYETGNEATGSVGSVPPVISIAL